MSCAWRGAIRAVLAAALVAGASSHKLQFAVMGKFKADRFVLRKETPFDGDTGNEWVVTDTLGMSEGVAWLAAFTTYPGDEKLEVEADGKKITIDLPSHWSAIHEEQDKAQVAVDEQWAGKSMALVEVPSHFSDVWHTFYEQSEHVILKKKPSEWADRLKIVWKKAWDLWDLGRVYVFVFLEGLGSTAAVHKVRVTFKEGGEDGLLDWVDRETKADTAWFATSVPIKGGSSGSFKVRVDSAETEYEMLYDRPGTEAERCKLMRSGPGHDVQQIFVAAFFHKEPFDRFRADVVEHAELLWDEHTGKWKFDEVIARCGKFHRDIKDDRIESGAAAQTAWSASPDGPLVAGKIPENGRLPMVLIVVKSSAAAALLLLIVWCFFCRGEGPNTDTNTTTDGAHWVEDAGSGGQPWEMDGVSGGFERSSVRVSSGPAAFDTEGPAAKGSLSAAGGDATACTRSC